MNTAVLVIAVLLNGDLRIESAYPMANFAECEDVATHPAVVSSYPDRARFCWDGSEPLNTSWQRMRSGTLRQPSQSAPAPEP